MAVSVTRVHFSVMCCEHCVFARHHSVQKELVSRQRVLGFRPQKPRRRHHLQVAFVFRHPFVEHEPLHDEESQDVLSIFRVLEGRVVGRHVRHAEALHPAVVARRRVEFVVEGPVLAELLARWQRAGVDGGGGGETVAPRLGGFAVAAEHVTANLVKHVHLRVALPERGQVESVVWVLKSERNVLGAGGFGHLFRAHEHGDVVCDLRCCEVRKVHLVQPQHVEKVLHFLRDHIVREVAHPRAQLEHFRLKSLDVAHRRDGVRRIQGRRVEHRTRGGCS
mmetsp:Transcript_21979/g.55379  ORF Transcript_21979/g.55379 Transcript_21979/m.55379 type:complete len:278 (-) Transcript_21979:1458-2291(-)